MGLVLGISVAYVMIRDKHRHELTDSVLFDTQSIRKSLMNGIDANRISGWLKQLTQQPITGEQQVIKYDLANHVIHKSGECENALNARLGERKCYEQNRPFLAYSNSTGNKPVKGIPVYVNYGRAEDYDYLKQSGVSVAGHIVIVRYAKIFPANIVKLAEDNNAIGAIIYSDPYDYTDGNSNNTFPNGVYLPESGVQRGTIRLSAGDPQTPFYPSIKSAYRLPIKEVKMPRIPAQAISYSDARYILKGLNGPKAPTQWVGGLNITYSLGPGYIDNSYIELEVNTYVKETAIHNIIGVITGCTEPDRFVLVGNHRDAGTFGALDPLSGTASMLELSAAFMNTIRTKKWCPRRSIVFCSWAAEEWGLIGSTEWVEEYQKLLASQAVAYINVDIAVNGNYSFQAEAVPLLYSTVWEATKAVSNPNENEVKEGLKTVYDSYLKHRPSDSFDWIHLPDIKTPGSGSDHMPFLHISGVPVINMYYNCDHSTHIKCYPLYHTMYETYDLMSNLTDIGFKFSKALTQIWAEMLRSLSDSPMLPISDSLQYYPHFLHSAFDDLNNSSNHLFRKYDISLDFLQESIDEFDLAINSFSNKLKRIDEQNALQLRRVNDILMSIERTFLEPNGLPFRKDYKHIILSPNAFDSYSGSSFAGLYHLLWEITHNSTQESQQKLLPLIKQHISVIVFHINAAKNLLKQSFNKF
ncbi:unnamed protein product [Medioppia subpectinata]|uniref:Aminopeptidase NAALADL1 n=1 Tax=Medioppia subpectinata TaxID=1979941 RepID=A0A7R9PV23_9ACAR|nr:unnamed protein product [Medioppia subpectinata]CAG2102362.1 unnamed protein product [Medioppia subpectinata]